MATGIIDTIKRASVDAYEATYPLLLSFGVVTSANPPEVKISNSLVLTQPFLVINGTIQIGDKVPLLREQGGQKYIVFGSTTAVVDQTKYVNIVGGETDPAVSTSTSTTYQYPYRNGYRLSTRFGKKGSWACGYHSGLDIVGTGSKQIHPIADGKVIGKNTKGSAYGNHVLIQHPDGYISLYAHMQTVYVKTGQTITKNTVVGIEGETGRAYGKHLHLEVHKGAYHYPATIDPEKFLKNRGAT